MKKQIHQVGNVRLSKLRSQAAQAHPLSVESSASDNRTESGARHTRGPRGANAANRLRRELITSIRKAIASGTISGELSRTLRRWAVLWSEPDLQYRIGIRYNSRLRTTIARWVIQSGHVEVGAQFFELQNEPRELLCHELAHAVALKKYGRAARPHGPEWSQLVRMAGYEPRAYRKVHRPERGSARGSRSPLMYAHRCTVCQSVRYGRKAVKSWRCAECIALGLSGELTINKIEKRGFLS